MPCNTGQEFDHTDYEAKRKIDDLTRMLCSLCRALKDVVELPPDIAAWYEKHRDFDRAQGRP